MQLTAQNLTELASLATQAAVEGPFVRFLDLVRAVYKVTINMIRMVAVGAGKLKWYTVPYATGRVCIKPYLLPRTYTF